MTLAIHQLRVSLGSFELCVDRLQVGEGEICCVMGASGSGKTTLFNAIAGFVPLEGGSLSYDSTMLHSLPPEKRKIALVFQQGALFPHLTVQRNIEFGLRVQGVNGNERHRRVREWLERLQIADLALRYPSEISGGQAQRVALARALVVGFPILLLDEPFSALDIPLQKQLRGELKRLVRDSRVCAMMVTHNPKDAVALADRIAILEKGRITAVGTLAELKNHPLLLGE